MPPLLAQSVATEILSAMGVMPFAPSGLIELGDPALLRLSMAQAAARYGVPDTVIPKRVRPSKAISNGR